MRFVRSIPLFCLLLTTSGYAQELQHELLVFGSGELVDVSNNDVRQADINRNKISADILFSLQRNSVQLFAEYLVSNHEADLERFQLGWQWSENTIVWLGRYHQPGSNWNHNHHHGQYLQTSVTRPAIDNWEDDGGVIPQHFTGALIESTWHMNGATALHSAIGVGIAPTISAEGLEAYDLTRFQGGTRQLGFQVQVGFLPDEFKDTEIGLVVAHAEMPAREQMAQQFSHVDLTVLGAYGTGYLANYKLLGAAYYATSQLASAQNYHDSNNHFATGYLQVERPLPHQLIPFIRQENTSNVSQEGYLNLFPQFTNSRSTLGMRWEFINHNALTLQIARSHTVADLTYHEIRLQWSAALF